MSYADPAWVRAWEALVRVFRDLTLEDQREVELYAAYLVQKRRAHEARIRRALAEMPTEEP